MSVSSKYWLGIQDYVCLLIILIYLQIIPRFTTPVKLQSFINLKMNCKQLDATRPAFHSTFFPQKKKHRQILIQMEIIKPETTSLLIGAPFRVWRNNWTTNCKQWVRRGKKCKLGSVFHWIIRFLIDAPNWRNEWSFERGKSLKFIEWNIWSDLLFNYRWGFRAILNIWNYDTRLFSGYYNNDLIHSRKHRWTLASVCSRN